MKKNLQWEWWGKYVFLIFTAKRGVYAAAGLGFSIDCYFSGWLALNFKVGKSMVFLELGIRQNRGV